MFRSAFNVMRATKWRLPQTLQRTITSLSDSTVASSPQTPLIGEAAVSRRFKNLKTQSAYDSLLRILDFEKKRDFNPGDYVPPRLQILTSPLDRTITYVWDYCVKRVLIMVYVPTDEETSEEEEWPVRVVVNMLGCDGIQVGFGIRVFDRQIIVDHVAYVNRMPPYHHAFNFSKDFDGDAQAVCYKILDRIGVNADYRKKHLLQLYDTYSARHPDNCSCSCCCNQWTH